MFVNDRYEVVEILGKGGNGIVYKVREKNSDRILAVKETTLECEESRKCMEKETEMLKMCFHPALPVVVESFWQENNHYLVMEYVEGVTLKEYVKRCGRLSTDKMLEFASGIGEVLNYLHSRSQPVIYGDLKPENIIITEEEQVRLIDFGTAVHEQDESTGCYASPGYAAPEQLKGRLPDIRSDIYSFGALMHYMLTGEDPQLPPYTRRALSECDIAISKGMDKVISKALKCQPEQRYQNIISVLKDLQQFSKNEKKEKLLWQFKQTVSALLFIAFAGFLYQAIEYWQWGITADRNTYLHMSVVFLIMTIAWRIYMISGVEKKKSYRLEKNIWKTDKQGIGLMVILFAMGIFGMEIGVHAEEKTGTLPAVIYDETGCKLLWQDDEVNELDGAFRIEIPKECFMDGKYYDISVILEERDNEQVYIKQFEVKSVKSSIEK